MDRNSVNGGEGIIRTTGRKIGSISEIGIFLGLLVMVMVFSVLTPNFLTVSNILSVVRQSSINAVIALGMTLVIISGGIDLSVGSVVALVAVVTATWLKQEIPVPVGVIMGISVGAIAGLINGLLISRVKLAPFIVTLGSMSYLRGIALVYSQGRPVYGVPATVRWLGNGMVWVIPAPAIVLVGMVVLSLFLLHKTRFGEYTFAIGGNEEAVRVSGVNVVAYKTSVYVYSGICASVAAMILMARINAAEPIAAIGAELDAIAAAVMGGTSLSGGVGTIVGTVLGALIIGGLRNGLNLLNVDANFQQVAIGTVIILAVVIDRFRKK